MYYFIANVIDLMLKFSVVAVVVLIFIILLRVKKLVDLKIKNSNDPK